MDFSFCLAQCLDPTHWGKIAHAVRDSIRRHHFTAIFRSHRHELQGQILPQFEASRLSLVRKWIMRDSLAIMLATGVVASGASRTKGQPDRAFLCPKCHLQQPHWDHYWSCWLQMDPPDDLLFRRYLWPRTSADFATCNAFKGWVGQLLDMHLGANAIAWVCVHWICFIQLEDMS